LISTVYGLQPEEVLLVAQQRHRFDDLLGHLQEQLGQVLRLGIGSVIS
jgi:hypothetical protein